MKAILYIEFCNFVDHPLGGHLSFAKHLTTAMKGDIDLVGITTDGDFPVGEWQKRVIGGYEYNYYNIKNQIKSFKKPIIPSRIPDYFTLKKHIKGILRHRNYDFIIVQTPEVLFTIPKVYRSRVILILPGCGNPLLISRYRFARKFAKLYDKLYFHYAKSVHISLAAADYDDIALYIKRSRGLIKNEKVIQFPTRYDANIFKVISKESARNELSIDKDELTIVTTGRLNWFKGWKFMIDSFDIFQRNHENAKLYFVGKGEDEQKIRDYIEQMNLSSKVCLAGVHPLPVVAKYLNAADMFVMGSYFEGWSTSLVEAIACANACVVTKFSSAHDLVKDGRNGFVQDVRNESGFAQLMEKALHLDKNVICQFAEDAYSMSVQTMREQLNNIIQFE